jgi:ribosome-associated protein
MPLDPEGLRVTSSCRIPAHELEWKFTASGGPGGQHANKAATRVELSFSVEASTALGPRQRERLLRKLGPVVRVVAADERSQSRNRELAAERLREKLADALRVEPPRVATKPTRASKRRRLDEKARRSQLKSSRRAISDD